MQIQSRNHYIPESEREANSDSEQNSRFQVEIDVTVTGKVKSETLNNKSILTSARTLEVMFRIGERKK